jgi:Family of unknown function (DUF5302)
MHPMSERSEPGTGNQSDEASGSDGLSDAQRRFREALDRKNSMTGEHPGNASSSGQKLKGSNSKRKREFRRKSGG